MKTVLHFKTFIFRGYRNEALPKKRLNPVLIKKLLKLRRSWKFFIFKLPNTSNFYISVGALVNFALHLKKRPNTCQIGIKKIYSRRRQKSQGIFCFILLSIFCSEKYPLINFISWTNSNRENFLSENPRCF